MNTGNLAFHGVHGIGGRCYEVAFTIQPGKDRLKAFFDSFAIYDISIFMISDKSLNLIIVRMGCA